MKKTLAIAAGSLAAVLAVVIARTATVRSRHLPAAALTIPPLELPDAPAHLARAVGFRTITYEHPGRRDNSELLRFHSYLSYTYPRVHSTMPREIGGGGSLLYRWDSRNAAAKRAVLMGHLDVVPATDSGWRVRPFDGRIVDGAIWGHGSLDDKGSVIAILEAAESPLASGFHPNRTIHFAFGHDEEDGGKVAASIATC